MTHITDADISRARAVPIESVIDERGLQLKRQGPEYVGACPKCGGDDRFAVNIVKGVFNCRGCEAKGDVIELIRFIDDVDFITACIMLAGVRPKANGKDRTQHQEERQVIVAEFLYHDEAGNTVFATERIEYLNADDTFVLKDNKHKKTFRQKRPDPDRPGKWIAKVTDEKGNLLVPVVPYRLPQLIEAIANNHPVCIVEGEAKADLLAEWNVAATCSAGGAKKWKPEHSQFFPGADVVLVPDNDDAGWEHINRVGAELVGIAKSVRVLVLPHVRAKDDVVDWAKAGGTREQLDVLLQQAQDWKPPSSSADEPNKEQKPEEKAKAQAREDELLAALTKAKGLQYERQRKAAAKELGVSPKAIDKEVRARREDDEVRPLYGHWVVEPWPEPVDGDALLRDVINRIQRHVVISADGALVIALWVILSWVHNDVATHSPILNINSAEPESGKSTTMGLIAFLMPRCIASVEASEAAIYRAIKRWSPSFCIDEFDSVLADDDKAAMRSVINSGHTRGQGVLRCIGDDKVPELFPTFAPKAIGMVGRKLPPATLSRCIFVELRRRKRGEQITKFKHEDDGELADLRRRLCRWALDNKGALRDAKPLMPEELLNRRADNWRVQLAISDLCSGAEDFGDKARAAATRIEGKADSRTNGVRVLADIKSLFEVDPQAEGLHSATIVAALIADPEKPWAEFSRAKPLTQNRLAKLLAPYRIVSENVTVNGTEAKGYKRSRFEEAWSIYVS
jgi:putative DNA primase/helicase